MNVIRQALEAALAYDQAIRACANDPKTMSEYHTVENDTLDDLYLRWMLLTREALAELGP